MLFLTLIVSFYIFIQTFGYGIYEIKDNKNEVGGIIMIVISVLLLIAPTILYYVL